MNNNIAKSSSVLRNADELAEQLQVSLSMAYTIMRQGQIPVVKIGRSRRVRQQDIDEYIRRNTIHAFPAST